MIVNQANAAVVAAIFNKLSDERFTMRTVGAFTKDTGVTEAQVLNAAAEMGMQFRTRGRDGAQLIERPTSMTPAQSLETAQKAQALLLNDGVAHEPFELNFADIMADVEGSDGTDSDEDEQFS